MTSTEARKRLLTDGFNELPAKKPPSSASILFDQFKSPFIYILLLSAIVTLLLRDFTDAIVILLAVFLNTILGFLQESRAQKAILALKNLVAPQTQVIRDGNLQKIPARELVAGDVVVLNSGMKIPADGTLLEAVELTVDESILTGEAAPVSKSTSLKENKIYMGTTVLSGRGVMEVAATGILTKIGNIATSISETDDSKTPLQKKLADLAKFLAITVGILSFLILLIGLAAGREFSEMFATSVALAVAVIPEGLAVSLTVILAIGMQRILAKKGLVKKLLAAEVLGSVTVICTDKTGTLTEGKFKVVSWKSEDDKLALNLATLCNNLSDPEELALWDYILTRDHLDPQRIREENPRVAEIPFSSKRKFMATVNETTIPDLKTVDSFLFVKGAPETILAMCKISSSLKRGWEEKNHHWASRGERVLGMAYKRVKSGEHRVQSGLNDLIFLGLVGFSDPPRPEAKEVLKITREAGIKIKVLTGDFRVTAETVLDQLGMKIKPEEILEGEELNHLTAEELRSCVSHIRLFARIDPLEKLRIVRALQENGEAVALIGDGVNDAPALKKAEVGIVVGEASEVAKETADMVLIDSNLKTLLSAIEEGRGIFDNLQKVIVYLLADAFGAVILVVGTLLISLFSGQLIPLPLTAAQILWINLVSDGFPNLALTVDPKEKGLMKEPPRKIQESIINAKIIVIIAVVSLFSGLSALLFFDYFFRIKGDLELARSVVFGLLGINTLFYVFSCRSFRLQIFKINPFGNIYLIWATAAGLTFQVAPFYLPFLRDFLRLTPLGLAEWGLIVTASLILVFWIELLKWIFNSRGQV